MTTTDGTDVPPGVPVEDFLQLLAAGRAHGSITGDDLIVLDKGCVVESGVAEDVVTRSGTTSLDAAFTRLTAAEATPLRCHRNLHRS